jgi:hypothetical protein
MIVMRKAIAILALVLCTAFFGGLTFASEEAPAKDLERIYSRQIDDTVARYNGKAELRNSRSTNVRSDAALYAFKAQFLERYKSELIGDMISAGIGTKPHQIQFYLNQRFFETLKTVIARMPQLAFADRNCP